MPRKSKRFSKMKESVDHTVMYSLEDTVKMLKELATAGFNETVEMAVSLNVNPKHADQMVRGTCILPNGTGREVKVLVFATGELAEQAKEAGADYVGDEDLGTKIEGGWLDFDVVIASPDMMRIVGKLGRVLGPRGLMPNPKTGTVTADVENAVLEAKAGKISFKVDKQGNLHVPLGKVNFEENAIIENTLAFIDTVMQLRPGAVKGRYMQKVSMSSTMGPGIRVDISDLQAHLK